MPVFPVPQDIVYYQGKLYVSVDYSGIYEIDASGTTRRQLLPPQKGILRMIVHRGYLYIATTDFLIDLENYSEEEIKEMACRVERYRLDQWDGKPETVYEIKGPVFPNSTDVRIWKPTVVFCQLS